MQTKQPTAEQIRKFEDFRKEPTTRSFSLKTAGQRAQVIDAESRTVELAFSSEYPVERWFGDEILDHSPESVDLSRLLSGGAVLMDHNTRDQIGVVESVRIDADRIARAVVRFSKSARATEIFQDVIDGIRTNISVGYSILDYRFAGEVDGREIYRVTRWQPYEISFVSVPADPTVGVGRSKEINPKASREETPTDPALETISEAVTLEHDEPDNLEDVAQPSGERSSADAQTTPEETQKETNTMTTQAANDVLAQERARVKELRETGERFGAPDLAQRCIDDGSDVHTLNALILERKGFSAQSAEGSTSIGLTDKEKRQFSFQKLIAAQAQPDSKAAQREASFELEVCAEAGRKAGKEIRGVFIPGEILAFNRAHSVGTAAAGGALVATELQTGSFIDLLRNRLAITNAGATVLTGLEGNLAIPRQTGGASAFWVAENGTISESSATFDQLTMSPKTVGALTELSRRALLQPSVNMEAFIQNELIKTLALEIDRAALNGSGSSNQPRGILQTAGIGAVIGGTNGAAINWGHVVDLETAIADENADIATMRYLTNARVRGKLKKTEIVANSGNFIWTGDSLNGYPTIVSNQVPKNGTKGTGTNLSTMVFGDFSQLILGFWSGLDLQVNPYSLDTSGAVRVTAFQDVDVLVKQPKAFAAMTDIVTV
jgi:HK97 family phage major capsid protein